MGKIKTRKYLRDRLYNLYRKGHGMQKNKDIHNSTPFIHSHNTYKTYLQQCDRFSDWAHSNGFKDPSEAQEHISDYIEGLKAEGKSSFTIYTALCAVCKGFGISTEDVPVEVPKRRRQDITRSRKPVENDRHISTTKNADLITFCQCFGLRKDRELAQLTTDQIEMTEDNIYITVKGKGGKVRTVEFFGNKTELTTCKRLIQLAGDGKVFPKLPSNLDVHYYRSVYACRLYKELARPTDEIPKADRYVGRKDRKGLVYDRKALLKVSKALGHNRACVVVDNYLYNL